MVCKDKPDACNQWSGAKACSGSSAADPCCSSGATAYGGCCDTPFSGVNTANIANETVYTLAECGRYVLSNDTPTGGLIQFGVVDAGNTEFTFVFPRTAESGIVLDALNLTNHLVTTALAILPPANINAATPYPELNTAGTLGTNLRVNLTNSSNGAVYFVASKSCDAVSIECVARSIAARPGESLSLLFDYVTRQWLVSSRS